MAKKSTKANKKPASKTVTSGSQRRLKLAKHKRFGRNNKKFVTRPSQKLTGAYRLFFRSVKIIINNWRLFLPLLLIYGALAIIFVNGVGNGLDLGSIKSSLSSGHYSQLATGTILFSYLLGSGAGSTNPAAGVYQTILVILMSLVIIWSLRQVRAGNAVRAREAFYNGTYPLVQFVLVLLTVCLQLLPLVAGTWVYSVVTANNIATGGVGGLLWLLLFAVLAVSSLYMIASSLFALYIVTLPNMTPIKALRSARELVKYRRWLVLRKILFLPLALIVVGGGIMIPLILLFTSFAQWIYFALNMIGLVVIHSYMYSLYRELI